MDLYNEFSIEAFVINAKEKLHQNVYDISYDTTEITKHGDHLLNPGILSEFEPLKSLKAASVLIPIMKNEGELSVLLTTRAQKLASHAGQIAFPGGKIDMQDRSPLDAALRETEEEVGISNQYIDPLGYLDSYQTRTGFHIIPIVGIVHPGYSISINIDEVYDSFQVPLDFLMCTDNHQIKSIEWHGKDRSFYVIEYQNRYIWGATAGIIRSLYERLYN